MTYLVRCPNCDHPSPWELRGEPIEVWCPNCCAYDYDETRPAWIYNFIVKPSPKSNIKKRPDEDRVVYGGWYLECRR